ncbi:MAG: cytochrome c oxidase subunit II [Alphaproteobacteria bacterium]
MTYYKLWTVFAAVLGVFLISAMPAFANEPVNYGMMLQPAATENAERINEFHNMLLWIITGITVFVFLLLVYVVVRFNRHVNKTPSKTTHNVLLEIVWTVVPVVILIIIAVPSFKILYQNDRIAEPDMVLKITGHQWYWSYEYLDHDGIAFNSYLVPEAELQEGQKRLLSTDNVVVLPVDTNISILVSAAENDVIHAWAVPAFGVKIDAVPMRMNETWFRITKPGIYYGQCSEICGKDHAFMPIEVHAVSKEEFEAWVIKAKDEFASIAVPSSMKYAALAK